MVKRAGLDPSYARLIVRILIAFIARGRVKHRSARDTDKSRCFTITQFFNCSIIQPASLFFKIVSLHLILSQKVTCLFHLLCYEQFRFPSLFNTDRLLKQTCEIALR